MMRSLGTSPPSDCSLPIAEDSAMTEPAGCFPACLLSLAQSATSGL
jgi:hypothetical protein